jgi:hypothetical protein
MAYVHCVQYVCTRPISVRTFSKGTVKKGGIFAELAICCPKTFLTVHAEPKAKYGGIRLLVGRKIKGSKDHDLLNSNDFSKDTGLEDTSFILTTAPKTQD